MSLKKNDIEALAKGLTGKTVDKPKEKGPEEQKVDESMSKVEDKKAVEDFGKTSKTNNSFLLLTKKKHSVINVSMISLKLISIFSRVIFSGNELL